jgi:hypothetical protein
MATVKVRCTRCSRVTNHDVTHDVRNSGYDDESDVHWEEHHQIIRCLGCDQTTFRRTFESSEDFDPYTGQPDLNETLYPDRSAGRTAIQGYEHFPARTRQVYLEVLKALNIGAPILAAVGLRAVVESVCSEQNVQGHSLENRINKLADMGVLSRVQADFLHAHRFLGNTAAHQIVAPKAQELVAALDIAETLLKTLYVLPQIAPAITTGVRARTPQLTAPGPLNTSPVAVGTQAPTSGVQSPSNGPST